MERVTGIGGFFFAAADPAGLARWYAEHLGIDPAPESYETTSWWQDAGPAVVAGMAPGSEHLGGPGRTWALTLRVHDLEAMVQQLGAAGVEVEVDPVQYPNGRFADLRDPEGNALQLWQPAGADLHRRS